MATAKKDTPIKMTAAQVRTKLAKVEEELRVIKEDTAYCSMCDTIKKKDKFYVCTDIAIKGGVTRICKECARKIALRVDKNGEEHEPTKESLILALRYLDKPFLESVYNSSIQESENLIAGRVKYNFATSYFKNIQMTQYVGMTYSDSDFYKERVVYEDEKTEEDIKNTDVGTYDQYVRDKSDTIRLLHYDPFEKEAIEDQPFLYSQLLGLLDSSEDANDDMMRTSSCISIVRSFLQQSKLDDTISKLMVDIKNMERNASTIKSLQESKGKIISTITSLAAESCISLKNNKNAKKGENTWTGKIKKIKELNIRQGEVNGFDIDTCRGMRQVMDASNKSILEQLHLDESEYSDMIAEMRTTIVQLRDELANYKELVRILLRENIDLKDTIKEQGLDIDKEFEKLDDLFSKFGVYEEETDLDIIDGEENIEDNLSNNIDIEDGDSNDN